MRQGDPALAVQWKCLTRRGSTSRSVPAPSPTAPTSNRTNLGDRAVSYPASRLVVRPCCRECDAQRRLSHGRSRDGDLVPLPASLRDESNPKQSRTGRGTGPCRYCDRDGVDVAVSKSPPGLCGPPRPPTLEDPMAAAVSVSTCETVEGNPSKPPKAQSNAKQPQVHNHPRHGRLL